jgi:hypothetical protein
MARGKRHPWEAIFGRIQTVYYADQVYPPRPTDAEFDEVENQLDFRFPASYQAFARQFGLGGRLNVLPELIGLTRPPGAPDWWDSVVAATALWRETLRQQGNFGHQELDIDVEGLSERLVVFGFDEGEQTFVFHPGEISDVGLRECCIYSIESDGGVRRGSDSFWKWLEWVALTYLFEDESEKRKENHLASVYPVVQNPAFHNPELMPYQRYSLRPKEDPSSTDVHRWLAWQDGLVHHIARSIRDERRLDTFPVLADALEEAGCSHADLLAACRSGDPEVDGVWVLHVLLSPAQR